MKNRGGFEILKQLFAPSQPDRNASPAQTASRVVQIEDFEQAAAAKPSSRVEAELTKVQKKLKRGKAKKSKAQTKLKLPPELVKSVYSEIGREGNSAKPSAGESASRMDFGESAFAKIQGMGHALEKFLADHRAPDQVGCETELSVRRAIEFCAANLVDLVDPEADGYIGYDFGTSSTKAVIRWPNKPRSPARAVPVPDEWCGGGVPHTWPSVVFLDPENLAFHLLPSEGRIKIDGFKAALIANQGNRLACAPQVTKLEAAVAFLALHLAYVIGTVGSRKGDKISLVNVAVPVAALADAPGLKIFDLAITAAISLIPRADRLTLADVRAAIAHPGEQVLEHDLHAELSGVIAGYCRSPRRHIGSHMVIDCGSATLDIATFRLEAQSNWPIGLYAAEVQLLGADSCAAYVKSGATWDTCSGAARYEDHLVYRRTLEHNRAGFAETEDKKLGYQIILAGGGIDNPAILAMLSRWQNAFNLRFDRPQLDKALDYDGKCPSSRLLLADGLAYDPINLRKVLLPLASTERPFNPSGHDWTAK